MKSHYPLTAFEAAHNALVMLCATDEKTAQEYLAYLACQPDEPYLNQVRDMVFAELPFWKLLTELPSMIEKPQR
jgi:hypothetical protein